MKRYRLFVILAVAVAMLTSGLMSASPSMAQSTTPKSGGTLRAAWDAEWVSLDPAISSAYSSFAVLNNVVEGLTAFDDNIKLIPWLAESWTQSSDQLTWTFKIRHGVKFSNGRDMTAQDVKYSFGRILDPKLGSGRVNSCGGKDAKVDAPDDYTFTVTTAQPNAILPITVAGSARARPT